MALNDLVTTDSQASTGAALSERLCAALASAAGQDPIGSGGTVTRLLAMEMPTPWGDDLYTADPHGTLQQQMRAVHVSYFQGLRGDGRPLPATGYPGFYGIAPDREWSRPDQRRVLLATRPSGPFAEFAMAEYLFPFDSPILVDLVQAFFEAPEALDGFDRFKTGAPPRRELFVCTHGQVDICCARFGVPLYRRARAAYPAVRAWRITHFGGHRYAPTAWEFPAGYKWAFLDEAAAEQVLRRDGPPALLTGKLRGWSGVPGAVQPLDREGLVRHGWDWLSYPRAGEIVEADEAAGRWRVRLTFEAPDGRGVYEGVVAVGRELPELGCGRTWGQRELVSREYVLEAFDGGVPADGPRP